MSFVIHWKRKKDTTLRFWNRISPSIWLVKFRSTILSESSCVETSWPYWLKPGCLSPSLIRGMGFWSAFSELMNRKGDQSLLGVHWSRRRDHGYWVGNLIKVHFTDGGCGLITMLCLILMTSWTVAHQTPLSMGFPKQAYWSGSHFLL